MSFDLQSLFQILVETLHTLSKHKNEEKKPQNFSDSYVSMHMGSGRGTQLVSGRVWVD